MVPFRGDQSKQLNFCSTKNGDTTDRSADDPPGNRDIQPLPKNRFERIYFCAYSFWTDFWERGGGWQR